MYKNSPAVMARIQLLVETLLVLTATPIKKPKMAPNDCKKLINKATPQ